jgi:hypothetical protein
MGTSFSFSAPNGCLAKKSMELWGRPLVFKFPTAEALIVLLFINPLNSQFRIFSHGILSQRSFVALCEDGSPALSNDDGSDFNNPHPEIPNRSNLLIFYPFPMSYQL